MCTSNSSLLYNFVITKIHRRTSRGGRGGSCPPRFRQKERENSGKTANPNPNPNFSFGQIKLVNLTLICCISPQRGIPVQLCIIYHHRVSLQPAVSCYILHH